MPKQRLPFAQTKSVPRGAAPGGGLSLRGGDPRDFAALPGGGGHEPARGGVDAAPARRGPHKDRIELFNRKNE